MQSEQEINWNSLHNYIENLIYKLHEEFGWFNTEEVKRTPERILKFYGEFINSNDFEFTTFPAPEDERDVIQSENNIAFYSLCSHHFLPFFGSVHISYLPDKKYCGISKLSRVVKKFASKPGMQEHLINEIANYLNEELEPRFLMVRIEARHLCKEMRGIRQFGAISKSSAVRFKPEMENKLDHLKLEVFNQ